MEKYPKWSQTQGTEFLEDIKKIIDDGSVKYEGLGTLNKTMTDPSHIYRGNGMTVVIKQNGEFHTLFESGT
ncbi:hypothetical protein GNQ08_05425 [Paenibacillus macerans]|uniref:Uncharacterized protein n=1 Tax=Paenibacillus macerans TaxID=44252 RepID=A0A6N8ESV2_PAEMA|nr:hypothetical protein [Paenibacillus macerans]MCY7556880.1 hypothetical protein [Paenibacillus macerans]MEC0150069.1 hypothetical protein [Paenibacillus macerans]MEC0330020.1 hypothetical protein [Paenibacillus macerans]MED4955173.1 hypothetical protein [Paenibacillus macerans]MUG21870.1 hypothetical protein [Paenibacillus macerans]